MMHRTCHKLVERPPFKLSAALLQLLIVPRFQLQLTSTPSNLTSLITKQIPTTLHITMFRSQIARQARLFSTTPVARKSPVETIKDAAKAVDRTISGAAVKGIEKGGK